MKTKMLLFLLIILTTLSCEDIIEDNLATRNVNLLAPPDSFHTTISTHTYWWDVVEGSEGYSLQIVSPSFDYIEQLHLDTNITSNKYDHSLIPGTYEWRVRAYNFSTNTEYTVHSLVIDSTPDISQQIIQLLSPSNFDTTNTTSTLFNWALLYNASDYNFQLYYQNEKIFATSSNSDTITLDLAEGDGQYSWEVRGQNEFSNTAYSSRSLFIDTAPPNTPGLLSPALNALLPDSVTTFQWDRGNNSGSSVKDSLYIATDLLMNNIIRDVYLAYPNYSDSLGPGVYYWRVRSIDKAGNSSLYSNIRNFTIEN